MDIFDEYADPRGPQLLLSHQCCEDKGLEKTKRDSHANGPSLGKTPLTTFILASTPAGATARQITVSIAPFTGSQWFGALR